MPTRSEIVAEARSWLDVPYRHQGRDRNGIDCVGIICAVAKGLGYEIVVPLNYSTQPSGNQLYTGCEKWLVKQDRVQLIAGDIAIMWGFTRGEAQHFAIIGDAGPRLTMIHAWSKHQKVVEHGVSSFWERRMMGVYCFPGTTEG